MRKVWKHVLLGFAIVLMWGQMNLAVMAEEGEVLPANADELSSEYVDLSDSIIQVGGYPKPYMSAVDSLSTSDERNQLKDKLYQALKSEQSVFYLYSYGFTLEDKAELMNLYIEVVNEHPELFFVEPYFRYSYFDTGEIAYLWFYYSGSTDEERQMYADAIKVALEEVSDDMTDVEKALVLHDYLAQNCSYAYKEYLEGTLEDNVFSAYGALVDKRAVCNGYASAYCTLLKEVGIDSFLCTSDAMDHAWNIVMIDGEWYHVDVTWDDPVWNKEGLILHEFFLLSDEEILNREHYSWDELVECTSTKYDANKYWWREIDSQIYVADDKMYYIDDYENNYGFGLMEKNGDTTRLIYESYDYWNVWNSPTSIYFGAFSYLSNQGDYFYFNDSKNLYAMSKTGNTPQVIYTYDGTDGYIYGAMVYKDGYARLNIMQNPNAQSEDYITVDLRLNAPVLNMNYDAKTISTTSAMVYSTDDGNTWKSCTANMGLTEFGWTETKNKTVLFKVPAAGGLFESDVTEVTIKALPGITAGNLNCFGDTTGTVTIQMIDANGSVAATTTVAGDSAEYGLGPVNAGNYTMRISKENHVTREYAVSVGDEALTMDIEIHLIGDISGDGTINARDKKMMYNHISGSGRLENYDLQVGDVSGDGTINARDKKMLYNHIAGISNLWE